MCNEALEVWFLISIAFVITIILRVLIALINTCIYNITFIYLLFFCLLEKDLLFVVILFFCHLIIFSCGIIFFYFLSVFVQGWRQRINCYYICLALCHNRRWFQVQVYLFLPSYVDIQTHVDIQAHILLCTIPNTRIIKIKKPILYF